MYLHMVVMGTSIYIVRYLFGSQGVKPTQTFYVPCLFLRIASTNIKSVPSSLPFNKLSVNKNIYFAMCSRIYFFLLSFNTSFFILFVVFWGGGSGGEIINNHTSHNNIRLFLKLNNYFLLITHSILCPFHK